VAARKALDAARHWRGLQLQGEGTVRGELILQVARWLAEERVVGSEWVLTQSSPSGATILDRSYSELLTSE
jgi:hypothetical protein